MAMRQAADILRIQTRGRGLVEMTREIVGSANRQAIDAGLLTLFCGHTSASLLIQENAAPEVRADLERCFAELAPEDPARYAHDDEGPDDMPAHIRAALTNVQLLIPVIGGNLALGTWQGIYLFEHRRRPHARERRRRGREGSGLVAGQWVLCFDAINVAVLDRDQRGAGAQSGPQTGWAA
jgi:secondary thiamine-phosphate synthase enzyme